MLKFEVTEVVRRITPKGGGQAFEVQEAYVHLPGSKYPERTEVFVPREGAYKPGAYTMSPDSFRIGQYNKLEVTPRLVAEGKG